MNQCLINFLNWDEFHAPIGDLICDSSQELLICTFCCSCCKIMNLLFPFLFYSFYPCPLSRRLLLHYHVTHHVPFKVWQILPFGGSRGTNFWVLWMRTSRIESLVSLWVSIFVYLLVLQWTLLKICHSSLLRFTYPKPPLYTRMHVFVVSKCMCLVLDVGFRFGNGFGYTNLKDTMNRICGVAMKSPNAQSRPQL